MAFDGIKGYLSKALVLMPPLKGQPLKLYPSTAKESIGYLLAQNDDKGHEHVFYYLSTILNSIETKYTLMTNTCIDTNL